MTTPEPLPKSLTNNFSFYGGKELPLPQYVVLVGVFSTLLGAVLVTSKLTTTRLTLADLALLGVATHKLSRAATKDRVTAPFRAPFTRYQKDGEPGEVEEESRGEGMQKAVGDLVTCPYCMAPWIASLLTAGWLVWPRQARLICGIFSAVTASHFLHKLYIKDSK